MRKAFLLVAMIGAALALAAPAMAAPTAQGSTPGFYNGRSVKYLDFGAIKLAPGNAVAPIWVVTNGTKRQHNIIDVAPGDDGYTPLWKVTMVTWKPGVTPRTLKSASAVMAAKRAGEVTLKKTGIVVNCPVLGFGQQKTQGFARGSSVTYLDLGPVKLAPGNDVAPIWVFANGSADQRNIIDTLPGDDDYTPLWDVNMVTWKDGVTPRTLRSKDDVDAALAAGDVTVAKPGIVVNCPVV